MPTPEVVVSGVKLSLVMPWGDLEWVDSFKGGTESISFSVARPHPLFRPSAIVELDLSGVRRAVGSMVEPEPGGRITAEGLHRLGEDEPALSEAGNASLYPNEVTDAALERGLPWRRTFDFGADPVDLDHDQPHSVAQVLDSRAQAVGGLWWITPLRDVRIDPWPTVSTLHLVPGLEGLTISRDGYASTLHARYLDSVTSTYKTVTRTDAVAENRWGRVPRTFPAALGEGSAMTEAKAIELVDGLLAQGASQIGWATPIEVQFGDVVNSRQEPVDLSVINRQSIRLHGLDRSVADLQGHTTFDMPVARVHHRSDGTALIEPRGLSTPMNDVLAGLSS